MADIFISYAKEDRPRVAALVKALAEYGWSIWWDQTIPAGKAWREVIGEALENAGALIVIWSKTSVKSKWVQEEADWGLERKILVPVLIDQIRPPLGFGAVQALDFVNWNPAKSSPEFQKLVFDLSTILGPCPKHIRDTEQTAENKFEQPTPHQAVAARVKLPEPRAVAPATTQPKPPEAHRVNNILRFTAVLGIILLMAGGIWWFISKSEEAKRIAKAKPPIFETKTGKLFVVGVPDNASIRILNVDKRFQQGIELEPGKYHVQVSSRDYETQDRWIELNANEEKRINFELKKEVPKAARLHVQAIPENAQVRILNIGPKFTPGMALEAGSYQLEVSAEGYETQIRWIELKPGDEKPFKFELTKKTQEPTKSRTEVPAPVVKPEPPVASIPSKLSLPNKITNSIGMEFILIPAGSFTMGSNTGAEDEKPAHEVKISQSFYLQTTEVTQGQWKKVTGDNPSKFRQCGDDCPVERVSWEDAQRFIDKLNQLEKTKAYRLPSEAGWEYACRAGTTTKYSFGDDAGKLGEYAWYRDNSNKRTRRVATRKPNYWGLYDMHGNVWDWVEDEWHDSYEGAPADGRALVGNPRGPYHVVRGGGWYSVAGGCRSAARITIRPYFRRGDVGFRLSGSIALVP